MPYSNPTSPLVSPAKEGPHSRKGFPSHPYVDEGNAESGPSGISGPMPGIPRRSSNASSRAGSPPMSRQGSAQYQPFPTASRPLEGLPRRLSNGVSPTNVYGLPNSAAHLPSNGEGSLGLKLHPSPTKHEPEVSMSSTETVESVLPPTPSYENIPLPAPSKSVPFPTFDTARKPLSANHPLRSSMSPPRIGLARRNSGMGHAHHRPGEGSLQITLPSSASSPFIDSPSDETFRPTRPTASMIRKKSGEVVKPSLKQRSMSTPDLSRQLPGEPSPTEDGDRQFGDERSKSVRFADADDDGTLENVVLFNREQKPTAVGRAADPDGHYTETETETENDASDFVQFRTRRNAAARALDEEKTIQLEGASRVPRLRTDFSPDARGALNGENVILERVELRSSSGVLMMQGTVIARNVAFQKWVAVRFTLDHWQTVSEVTGNHITHIPAATSGDEGWDRFSFSIKLEDYKRKLDERQLLMCIRFSIEGREWWDSNNGMNYLFGFKKASPKRPTRVSGPASLGSSFMRLNQTDISGISGLRQNRDNSPSRQIAKAFGADRAQNGPASRPSWMFPRPNFAVDTAPFSRPDSPALSPPPAVAYKAPPAPDVHTHLSLSKYCAPSPPKSPLETLPAASASVGNDMMVLGGQHATLSPPVPAQGHERRASWNGDQSENWDSFSQVMNGVGGVEKEDEDGDATPIAPGSRSPELSDRDLTSEDSSPEPSKPLMLKRSTGDLRALVNNDAGLITPPASNLSSPPSPPPVPLPALPQDLLSPSPSASSALSTGDSSPSMKTASPDSSTDLASLHSMHIEVDPAERRKQFDEELYNELVKRFCFYTSSNPSSAEDTTYNRTPNHYTHHSGHSSPNGFPFGHHSPYNGTTPTGIGKRDDSGSRDDDGRSPSTPRPSTENSTPTRR